MFINISKMEQEKFNDFPLDEYMNVFIYYIIIKNIVVIPKWNTRESHVE